MTETLAGQRAEDAASNDAERKRAFELPHGLLGFPNLRAFALEDGPAPETAFKVLRSTDDEAFAMLVLPAPLEGGWHSEGELARTAARLGYALDDLVVLVVVTARREDEGVAFYVNLRAPIFVDAEKARGAQIVLENPTYSVRALLE